MQFISAEKWNQLFVDYSKLDSVGRQRLIEDINTHVEDEVLSSDGILFYAKAYIATPRDIEKDSLFDVLETAERNKWPVFLENNGSALAPLLLNARNGITDHNEADDAIIAYVVTRWPHSSPIDSALVARVFTNQYKSRAELAQHIANKKELLTQEVMDYVAFEYLQAPAGADSMMYRNFQQAIATSPKLVRDSNVTDLFACLEKSLLITPEEPSSLSAETEQLNRDKYASIASLLATAVDATPAHIDRLDPEQLNALIYPTKFYSSSMRSGVLRLLTHVAEKRIEDAFSDENVKYIISDHILGDSSKTTNLVSALVKNYPCHHQTMKEFAQGVYVSAVSTLEDKKAAKSVIEQIEAVTVPPERTVGAILGRFFSKTPGNG